MAIRAVGRFLRAQILLCRLKPRGVDRAYFTYPSGLGWVCRELETSVMLGGA